MNHNIVLALAGLRCLRMTHKILQPQDFTRDDELITRDLDGSVTIQDSFHYHSIKSNGDYWTMNTKGIEKLTFSLES